MEETSIINQSSIELGKNTRGYTYTVKAYGTTPEEIVAKLRQLKLAAEEMIRG